LGIYVSASDSGTNPLNRDSDNDQLSDKFELGNGLNPLANADFVLNYPNAFPATGSAVSITGFAWPVLSPVNASGDILLQFFDPNVPRPSVVLLHGKDDIKAFSVATRKGYQESSIG
jgi:hypothetical protein